MLGPLPSVNDQQPTVLGGPAPVLDVLVALHDERCPGLADCEGADADDALGEWVGGHGGPGYFPRGRRYRDRWLGDPVHPSPLTCVHNGYAIPYCGIPHNVQGKREHIPAHKHARMTTSWSRLTSSDEAHRRAAGRRHYNAVRQIDVIERRVEVRGLIEEYGWGHGARQRIADELGVDRSTISRDFRALGLGPRPGPPSVKKMSTAQWIKMLEPLSDLLVAQGCDCEDGDELHHKLSHVFRMAEQMLYSADDGKVDLSEAQLQLLERMRDALMDLL